GCHIGEYSKVGGEISNSIIQGYSNKAHEGFLGTSYIGRWCNLGAGTNVSNLKNNYGTIHVWNQGEMIDSGLQFQGLIMGDHCKTAIGTRFNTGTVVDTAANIFCPDFPPKYIPAFNWGGDDPKLLYAIDKFLETASIVLKRKGLSLNDAEINALKSLHKNQEKY
ncbi:MAG: glucose-1-phosphate thymidylyltransferase, partial [Candidatus Marinimicrobia bacterium]|nr:glucose-1-phosphate thymidylyltransferase [Candidatus Neomarinimicrobiota bacterium]